MAHNLRPFRDYSEHEVVNLFTFSGTAESASVVLTKGAVVKVEGHGVRVDDSNLSTPIESLGALGASYDNIVSDRWGTKAKVSLALNSGETPLGITLMDIRELDENGEKLVFNPRKAAEMGVVVGGQTVPVLTRGVILYSGVNATSRQVAYVSANGDLTAADSLPVGAKKVGTFLGGHVNGVALLKVEL